MDHDLSEAYSRYTSALAGLTRIPTQLARDLELAERNRKTQLAEVETTFRAEAERLERLRRTTSSRYEQIAKTLRNHDVLVPTQLRAETSSSSKPTDLNTALRAQEKAISDVETEIRVSQASRQREQAAEETRRSSGQQAAEALKRRQDQVRRAREENAAEHERLRRAAQAHARMRKILTIAGAVLILSITVLAVILWLNT